MSSFHDIKLPPKGSRFRAVKITVDNRLFDSKGEAKRYVALRKELQAGEIEHLQCQVHFKLSDCTYIADFVYKRDGIQVVEDYKGIQTDVFKRKKKLMRKELGIEILITRKPTVHSKIGKRRNLKIKTDDG